MYVLELTVNTFLLHFIDTFSINLFIVIKKHLFNIILFWDTHCMCSYYELFLTLLLFMDLSLLFNTRGAGRQDFIHLDVPGTIHRFCHRIGTSLCWVYLSWESCLNVTMTPLVLKTGRLGSELICRWVLDQSPVWEDARKRAKRDSHSSWMVKVLCNSNCVNPAVWSRHS
jgi:hypothetical protein